MLSHARRRRDLRTVSIVVLRWQRTLNIRCCSRQLQEDQEGVAGEQNCPQAAEEVAAHHRSASECQLAPSDFGSSRHTVVEAEPVGRPCHKLPSLWPNHRTLRRGLPEGSERSKSPKLRSPAVAQV